MFSFLKNEMFIIWFFVNRSYLNILFTLSSVKNFPVSKNQWIVTVQAFRCRASVKKG
ncbi:hypothetical protein D2M30_1871 [Bacillus amyloliquefaciens]|nr:hypothetical protein LL3_01886 [Bacillus amyloliquefaciens LL3]KYC94978.1 hypothetical protein B425_1889 [Bacillus amyloliquefaciens]QBG56201.1 hypothetical protein D2M30_1871 [Bacillus amyloliquefaciens]